MKFYLQHGNTETEVSAYRHHKRTTVSEPRDFIDDHMHQIEFEDNRQPIATSTLVVEIEAASWLDARALA